MYTSGGCNDSSLASLATHGQVEYGDITILV